MADESENFAELSVWQDVLDEVMAGRTQDHQCPFCGDQTVEAQIDEFELKVTCTSCGKYVEGQFR